MPLISPLSPQAQSLIEARLAALAADHQVKLAYACESGSRAWGFPSPDSDYDVRFIYVHPKAWYLALEEGRDVIDLPMENSAVGLLDFGGWDVRKTLRLVRKSNPVIWEWLQSPIIYQGFDARQLLSLRDELDPFYSPITACHHYLSLARGTMERELTGTSVKIKKYFYMLRPLLAAAWIERYHEVPPMELTLLLALLDDQPGIKESINALLERKQVTDEQVPIARIAVIDDFLAQKLARLQESAKQLSAAAGDPAKLDRLFLEFLGEQK